METTDLYSEPLGAQSSLQTTVAVYLIFANTTLDWLKKASWCVSELLLSPTVHKLL